MNFELRREWRKYGMRPSLCSCPGFTLIELLIVITILAVLAGMALLDYGFSVKKAHIQVATEELVALFGDATVRSQTQFSEIEAEDEDSIVVCYGVTIGKDQSPILFKIPRDTTTETCLLSADLIKESETVKELSWENLVFVKNIQWTAMSVSGSKESVEDETWITFLFSPPRGDISVYLNADSPNEKEGMTEALVTVTYQNSSESVLQKNIKINPVTASFMIEQVGEYGME